jgi:drug/metabolite transporter (DMT)-like permease
MLAIVAGLATAVLWATTLLGSSRSARLIGATSTLAWVMLIGLVVTVPLIALTSPPVTLTAGDVVRLAIAGFANTGGLLLAYAALRRGKVGVVGPIVSTEGAIAAALAILAGDVVTGATVALLALIAAGVALAAVESGEPVVTAEPIEPVEPQAPGTWPTGAASRRTFATAALAIGAAVLFGVNLFVTSRIAGDLPIAWAVLPARLVGVLVVTIPLVLTRRIKLERPAVPLVVVIGLAEVAGVATFAIGARESAAVTAVLASQFAGIAAVAAWIGFGERLRALQVAGVVVIAVGVALLAAIQA